jgi:hypothetical protein
MGSHRTSMTEAIASFRRVVSAGCGVGAVGSFQRSAWFNCCLSVSSNDTIDSSSFNLIRQCVHCRDCPDLPKGKALTVSTLCNLIGNERLVLFLLFSLSTHSNSNASIFTHFCGGFCDANTGHCACRYYASSINRLRCLNRHTLHAILSSRSVRLETEDTRLKS